MKEYIAIVIGILCVIGLMVITWKYSNYALYDQVQKLNSEITESRHREELLYQECKNLDYEVSVLTESIKEK